MRTLWLANDNDFLTQVPDKNHNLVPNPNQFFVFGFTDADLARHEISAAAVQVVSLVKSPTNDQV